MGHSAGTIVVALGGPSRREHLSIAVIPKNGAQCLLLNGANSCTFGQDVSIVTSRSGKMPVHDGDHVSRIQPGTMPLLFETRPALSVETQPSLENHII